MFVVVSPYIASEPDTSHTCTVRYFCIFTFRSKLASRAAIAKPPRACEHATGSAGGASVVSTAIIGGSHPAGPATARTWHTADSRNTVAARPTLGLCRCRPAPCSVLSFEVVARCPGCAFNAGVERRCHKDPSRAEGAHRASRGCQNEGRAGEGRGSGGGRGRAVGP